MLKIDNINLYYGGIHALKDLSLDVKKGEIVTLIGANGAGKTSTLRAISGLEPIKAELYPIRVPLLIKFPLIKQCL